MFPLSCLWGWCLTLQLPVSSPCSATGPAWSFSAGKSSVLSVNAKTHPELTSHNNTFYTGNSHVMGAPQNSCAFIFLKQNSTDLLCFIKAGAQHDHKNELESDIPLCSALRVLTLPRQMEYVLLCTICLCEQNFHHYKCNSKRIFMLNLSPKIVLEVFVSLHAGFPDTSFSF